MTYRIELEEEQKKPILDHIISKFGHLEAGLRPLTYEYYNLILENPIKAIKRLPEYIEKAQHINPTKASAEDQKPQSIDPTLDILGLVYSYLDKKTRKKGLELTMDSLDKMNYLKSQDKIELINDPWLASDIIINRPAYQCGYSKYTNLLEKNKSWADFKKATQDDVPSRFWLSYAIIQPRFSTNEVRDHYCKENFDMIDKTLDAAAAMIKTASDNDARLNDLPLDEGISERIERIDIKFHDRIKKKIKEEKWIFLDHK